MLPEDIVKENPYSIVYVDHPSEKIQLIAVNESSLAIKYITNPTEKVQLIAVEKNPFTYWFIIKKGITPSSDVELLTVIKDPEMIRYMAYPNRMTQLTAVKHDLALINNIVNPDPLVIEYVNKNRSKVDNS